MREDVLACAVDFPELLVNTPARSLVFVIHSSRRSWALFWVMKWLENHLLAMSSGYDRVLLLWVKDVD